MKTRKLVLVSIGISIAVVLSIVESFIPMGIPGVKIGLANVITIIFLYLYSPKEATLVQIFRIFLVGLLYSGILSISFIISLVSGILSLLIMILLYKTKKCSIFTISIVGSIIHSISEILVAYFILTSIAVLYYLPIILCLSIITGIITATISKITLKYLKIEMIKPKVVNLIIVISLLCLSIILVIVEIGLNAKDNSSRTAVITYRNNVIAEIDLDDPTSYKIYSNEFIDYMIESDSYLFKFQVYNNDEKDYFYITIEVLDGKIRIKEETCKKHICSQRGFIKNKYESIICLPNEFIITIEDNSLSEIDKIM